MSGVTNAIVAPLVGAWIEIFLTLLQLLGVPSSLPSWERGLKSYPIGAPLGASVVAPLVGAWIEIEQLIEDYERSRVAPLVGAWIEI